MKAGIVDLRYRMNDVLKALERNEEVSILYHGRVKGVLISRREARGGKVADHAFFNMRHDKTAVRRVMDNLRGGSFSDL